MAVHMCAVSSGAGQWVGRGEKGRTSPASLPPTLLRPVSRAASGRGSIHSSCIGGSTNPHHIKFGESCRALLTPTSLAVAPPARSHLPPSPRPSPSPDHGLTRLLSAPTSARVTWDSALAVDREDPCRVCDRMVAASHPEEAGRLASHSVPKPARRSLPTRQIKSDAVDSVTRR